VSTTDSPGRGGTAARKAARGSSSRPPASRSSSTSTGAAGSQSSKGSKGAKDRTPTRRQIDPDALAALEEERDFLLRSLDDLEREHDAGDVDDTDYAELKDDYTARAANAIRAIDDRDELAASVGARSSWARTAGVLCIIGVLALGLGWFVFRDAGTRAPGQGLSGDARQDSANLVLQGQQQMGQAQVALRDGDSDAAVASFQDAIQTFDQALDISPANPEALTWRGWTLHNVALASASTQALELDAQAMQWLDQAVAADADYALARLFRARLLARLGEFEAAQADLDAMDETQIPSMMSTEVGDLRAEVAAGLAGSAPITTP
jgi:tetratricopeptide (TPR) repeat protein